MNTRPRIHGNRPVFSASTVLEAVGSELSLIKSQDKLTWGDIARVLGKSEDQAAKYADGTAEMGIVAFSAAKREWSGRFTGSLDRLCHDSRPAALDDRHSESRVLKAALALSIALADDDEICAEDVRKNRPTIEAAIEALNGLLGKLVRAARPSRSRASSRVSP